MTRLTPPTPQMKIAGTDMGTMAVLDLEILGILLNVEASAYQ